VRIQTTVIPVVLIVLAAGAALTLRLGSEPFRPALALDQARNIALEHIGGGTIEEEELERDGDGLIYSFDVRLADGRLSEVEVDAMTGAVARDPEGDDADDPEDDPEDPDDASPARPPHGAR
jgi:hypothetical protein